MFLVQFLYSFRGGSAPHAYGAVVDICPLVPFAVRLVGGGHRNFVDELIRFPPFFCQRFFSDEMSGANVRIAVVGGTREKRLLPLVIVGGAVFQPTAAIGTVEKPGEHTHSSRPCGPAAVLAEGFIPFMFFHINLPE